MTTLPTNADRAERVRGYLIDYKENHDPDEDVPTLAAELIADILHLVNQSGFDPQIVWGIAYDTYYIPEVEEENQ